MEQGYRLCNLGEKYMNIRMIFDRMRVFVQSLNSTTFTLACIFLIFFLNGSSLLLTIAVD
jgi:hypothetical protein